MAGDIISRIVSFLVSSAAVATRALPGTVNPSDSKILPDSTSNTVKPTISKSPFNKQTKRLRSEIVTMIQKRIDLSEALYHQEVNTTLITVNSIIDLVRQRKEFLESSQEVVEHDVFQEKANIIWLIGRKIQITSAAESLSEVKSIISEYGDSYSVDILDKFEQQPTAYSGDMTKIVIDIANEQPDIADRLIQISHEIARLRSEMRVFIMEQKDNNNRSGGDVNVITPDVVNIDNFSDQNIVNIRRMIVGRFSLEDIQVICFDIGIDYEDLHGSTKSGKTASLMKFVKRYKKLPDLISAIQYNDPNIDWSQILS